MPSFPSATLKARISRILILSQAAAFFVAPPSTRAANSESPQALVATQDRERILQAGNAALGVKSFSITHDRSPLSEGGPHDFFSMSDYYWPDPDKPDGKPFIRRDGESYPGLFNQHRQSLMGMRDATSALAAAFQLTKDERYAAKASEQLEVFFMDPATRMNPELEHAQVMVGIPAPTRGIGLIDTLHLIEVPMAILALEGSKALTPELEGGLKQWFKDRRARLRDISLRIGIAEWRLSALERPADCSHPSAAHSWSAWLAAAGRRLPPSPTPNRLQHRQPLRALPPLRREIRPTALPLRKLSRPMAVANSSETSPTTSSSTTRCKSSPIRRRSRPGRRRLT
ncbi:MAG TPA: alginate lyase family protein [Planctomycetaceae bacterium]|nr:alginate lyase family protein [Planctomycetaceae bacterium]